MSSPPVVNDYLVVLYTIPEFIPDGRRGRQRGLEKWVGARRGPSDPTSLLCPTLPVPLPAQGLEFLMILGTESYTNFRWSPRACPTTHITTCCSSGATSSSRGMEPTSPAPRRVGLHSEVTKFSGYVCARPSDQNHHEGKHGGWGGHR